MASQQSSLGAGMQALAQRLPPHDKAPVGWFTVLLDDAAVRLLLSARDCALPEPLLGLPLTQPQLRVVVAYRSFSTFCRVAGFVHRLRAALEAAGAAVPALQVVVLGNHVEDARQVQGGSGVLAQLVATLAERLHEARRRADDHFERCPLTLPAAADGALHLLDADGVANFLRQTCDHLPAGIHLVYALPSCPTRDLVQALAQAAGVPCREASAAVPLDAVGEIVAMELRLAGQLHALGREAEFDARDDDEVQLHGLAGAAATHWQQLARFAGEHAVQAYRAYRPQAFARLPGLQQRATAELGVPYLRCGQGSRALLLVNAFGLPLDVWHALASRLAPEFTLLALDEASAGDGATACYPAPQAPAAYAAAVCSMLEQEGFTECSVIAWCAGAKFALELARRQSARVRSLMLLAPSFAGEPAHTGADSPFENSLQTMCGLVQRMPSSAESMARSMVSLLARSQGGAAGAPVDPSGAVVFALPDAATMAWVHAPFVSGPSMVDYSRKLLAFRAHQVSRSADLARLQQPVLLVTAAMDTTTSNARARQLCLDACSHLLHFELRHAGHYFLHQNSELVARLLQGFLHNGMLTESPHPRFERLAVEAEPSFVAGEL